MTAVDQWAAEVGLDAPLLDRRALTTARLDLIELGTVVGYIPAEAREWLEAILDRRDAAAVWLAAELRAVVGS
jgi:hypothetical protein